MAASNHHVVVLGGGAFGVALSKIMADKGLSTELWARNPEVVASINQFHHHPKRLSHVRLPDALKATTDLQAALSKADIVISALPMVALTEVWQTAKPFIQPHALVVSTTKGIEDKTLRFSSDILAHILGPSFLNQTTFLSGPSFASELAQGLPTALTLAGAHLPTVETLQVILSGSVLRCYASQDVIGLEVAGALKNVIAIAAGAVDGLELGNNAKAALITRGLAEITRLAVAMGGMSHTFSGLAGIGDLFLTCHGPLSRNRMLGFELAKGRSLEATLTHLGQVVEGVNTTRSVNLLCEKYKVDMPISKGVYRLLFDQVPLYQTLTDLLARKLGFE